LIEFGSQGVDDFDELCLKDNVISVDVTVPVMLVGLDGAQG
jgi:hypothetical protein